MTTILIIRHGNTLENLEGLYAGHVDATLSPVGVKQADIVCDYVYKNYKVDKIYTSDLSRAIKTAKPLADKLGIEITTDYDLREMFGGKWEGHKIADLPKLFPEDFAVWQNDVGFSRCTGGESYAEVCDRAINVIERIAKENLGKVIAIVTHGGFIRGLECKVRGVELKDMATVPYVANASVSVIEYNDGEFNMVSSNDNSFLGALQTEMPKGI